MPGKPVAADKLFQHLMQMQEQAFRDRRFEVSFHLLAAAVHAAEELKSVGLLKELGALASSRQEELDRKEPVHAISTAAAQARGNSALFATLATTANATRARIAADAAVGRIRGRLEGQTN
jgi:hypothetical protein